MTTYDFDKIVDRSGSGDLKHEVLAERYGRSDLLPLWVADMDFETPQFITDALRRRLDHSLFGYTIVPRDFWPTVRTWIADHHQWQVEEEWMRFIPGIVKGIGFVINVFTKEDEKVIIQPPVYHPFRLTPEGNRREVVMNPLIENADGSYSMDFDNLAKVADSKCRVLILSNPHNPAGIVWDVDTLRRLADFCYERGIIVISDEIHCDMALYGNKHAASRLARRRRHSTSPASSALSAWCRTRSSARSSSHGLPPTSWTSRISSRPSPPSPPIVKVRSGVVRCCATWRATSTS